MLKVVTNEKGDALEEVLTVILKDKRTPVTTPPYQVPSVDVTLDPPTFSLDTTFKIVTIKGIDRSFELRGESGLI